MSSKNKWRVKVYLLGGDGEWIDNGTGYLDITNSEVSVYNEDYANLKIISYKVKEEDYRRQGDTILTWVSPEGITYALSFQEKIMAEEVLEEICKIQSKNPKDVKFDEDICSYSDLSSPSISNLSEILLELVHGNRDRNLSKIMQTNFIEKICEISAECKDPENLQIIFQIFKQMCKKNVVHLNSSEVIDMLLDDPVFTTVIKALENDPGLNGLIFDLEQFYESSKLNNVLDIEDKEFIEKINSAHRLQFVRDTALPRSLDDSAGNYLFGLQQIKWKEVVLSYKISEGLRKNLYEKLKTSQPGALEFLIELFNIVKVLHPEIRHELYETLFRDGVIALLHLLSKEPNPEKILEFLGEIFTNVLDISPFMLKNYLFLPENDLGASFFVHISSSLIHSENIGTVQEIGRLIRALVEPDPNSYYDRILDHFYNDSAPILLENIDTKNSVEIISEIFKIFTACFDFHCERMKNFSNMNELLPKVSAVIQKNKHAAVYGLKLFKTAISKNDPFINNYLIRMNLFQGIFSIFFENSAKKGLLFSSVLSILEIMKKSSLIILKHLITNFLPMFKEKELENHLEIIIEIYNKQKNNEES